MFMLSYIYSTSKEPGSRQSRLLQKASYLPAAIEIGASALRLVQVAKAADKYRIAKIAWRPLPAAGKPAGQAKDALLAFVKENKVRGEVVTSLPLSKTQSFFYTFPNMPEREIGQAVGWKLKHNPPAGLVFENASFDYTWRAVAKEETNKEIQVQVFAAAKEAVMERMNLFKGSALEVIAVEPKPYAACTGLLWPGKIKPEETLLLLELGASESAVAVVTAGQPCFIRPLSISGNSLTQAIAGHYQLEWQKAEALKINEGLKSWDAAGAGISVPAIASQLEGLVVEIEHEFKFFSYEVAKAAVNSFSRVILCGGAAALKNLDKFLSERLGVSVEVFNPFVSLEFYPKEEAGLLAQRNAPGFAACVGMGLRCAE